MSAADLSIREAGDALRRGDLSSRQLLDAVLERAAFTEAQLHGYLTIDREGARRVAEAADQELAGGNDRGPLHGIPMAVKDNICTRGIETTCSSQILAGYRPPYDATVIVRLREAGAVLIGKTNLDEFAMGSSTENSAYGPTRNPWDPDKVPGGSSGGSAAVVAVGSALAALGSDTGGSIRQPASLCGVVGMKPTYGLVSRYGLVAFGSSLDQIGPITRTVADAATVFSSIAGHDPLDATSYPGPVPAVAGELERGVAGMKVGVITQFLGEGIQPAVAAATRKMVDRIAGAGALVDHVDLPVLELALSAYYLVAPAEASANLARFDGVRYGLRIPGSTVEQMMGATRADGFGPEVKRRILLGTYALSAGYHDAFYGQAQRVRARLRKELEQVYERFDVLVSPTSPTTAFPLGARTDDPLAMYLSDVCNIPANLAGHPAISVPIGVDDDDLPIGFQVMAPALGEAALFRVAAEVERLAEFHARPALAREAV